MNVEIITKETFNEKVKNWKWLILVDFYADWCWPCQMMLPILEELNSKNIVTVYKVNVDSNPELATEFRIRWIPTMLLFNEWQLVDQIVGIAKLEDLEDIINKYRKG